MEKTPAQKKKLLKELNAQIKVLQEKLVQAKKLEGKDPYIDVKVEMNQASFRGAKPKESGDTVVGNFLVKIAVTAKQGEVFVPVSIASGKKVAGFMYQIEGTAEGSVATADIKVRGDGVLQVAVGTLHYAKIEAGQTATFEIRATVRGKYGKSYKIVFSRLNYKLHLADARYQQYLKEMHSKKVTFS